MANEAQKKLIAQIESNAPALVSRLAEAVAIPSVSGDAKYRPACVDMANWLLQLLNKLGAKAELKALGKQKLDGQEIELPPVVFADYGSDKNKKTILIYGHYDVQPALKTDGWNTDPFTLVHDKETDRLYGRGSTDDKGPVLGWLNVVEAHQQAGLELPVNLKFCFEGMEETGSVGLDALIAKEKDSFFTGVDAVCISDNYWLTETRPCLTYGLRGVQYFQLHISGPASDLHSGVYGGVVHEPLTDLFSIMSKLVTPTGEILVPGIKELVAPLTAEEKARYDNMAFTIKDIQVAIGSETTVSDDKASVLMGRMRYPSLSLHGIEGAFSEPGAKTVIPGKVAGKFSVRLVPDMKPKQVIELVSKYIDAEFKKLNSKNTIRLEAEEGGKPWVADPNHFNFAAAARATETVYGVKPDLTREGGSIPVTLTFAEILNKNVLLLPMGRNTDSPHAPNERLDLSNYIKGTQLLGCYLHEIAAA